MRLFGKMLALLFVVGGLFAVDAYAGCNSGCGLVLDGVDSNIRKLAEAAMKEGMKPASCRRTPACQQRLITCYRAHGQDGRAAKRNSKHLTGQACDFSPQYKSRLSQLKRKLANEGKVTASIQELVHKGAHGGGLHDYVGGAREVASDGNYQSPKRMRNICVRWKDVPWCKAWIAKGNKPGPYPY